MRDLSLRIVLQLIANQFNNAMQLARSQLGDFSVGARSSDVAVGGFQQRINSAVRSVLDFGGAIRSLVLGFSLLAMVAGVKELIQFADNLRLVEGRIRNASTGVIDFANNYAQLVAISLRTHSAFAENAQMFARLNKGMIEMGGTSKDTLRQVDLLAKSMRISNTAASESVSTIRQWGQAIQSGLFRGDEFNSIAENAPRIRDAIAAGLGVSIGALRAMAEAGELTSARVVTALVSQGKVIDEEFKKIPISVGAAWEDMRTGFGQYIADADRGKGATAGLAGNMEWLAQNIGTVIDALITLGKLGALMVFSSWISGAVSYIQSLQTVRAEQAQLAATTELSRQAAIAEAQATLASTEAIAANTVARAADAEATSTVIAAARAEAITRLNATNATINQTRAAIAAIPPQAQTIAINLLMEIATRKLSAAEEQRAVILTELGVLGQQNANVSAELTALEIAQTESTIALAAAQEQLNLAQQGIAANTNTLRAAFTGMNAVMSLSYVAMVAWAAFMIGDWARGFHTVRIAAIYMVDGMVGKFAELKRWFQELAIHSQLLFTIDKAKREELLIALSDVRREYDADVKARQAAKNAMLDEEEATNHVKTATEQLLDTFKVGKTPQQTFKEKTAELTKEFNAGRVSLELYTKALNTYYEAMQTDVEKQKTPAQKEQDRLQDEIDKATKTPHDYQLGKYTKQYGAIIAEQLMVSFDFLETHKLENKLEKGVTTALKSAFDAATEKYKLPAGLLQAVAKTESDFRQFDASGKPLTSSGGAIGTMQVIPSWHPKGEIDNTPLDKERLKNDAAYNIDRGAQFLASLVSRFHGDLTLALQAYNASSTKVQYAKDVLAEYDKLNGTDLAQQFASKIKFQESTIEARQTEAQGKIDLTLRKVADEAQGKITQLEQLKQTGKIGIADYYDALTAEQLKIAQAKANAVKSRLAELNTKEGEATSNAAPEDLPKIKAKFAVDRASLNQDLVEIEAQIQQIPAINLIEKDKELAKVKEIQAQSEFAAANDAVDAKQAEIQQLFDLDQISQAQLLDSQRNLAEQSYQIALAEAQRKRDLMQGNIDAQAQADADILALTRSHYAKLTQLGYLQEQDKKRQIEQTFEPLGNAIEQSASGIITGQQTVENASKHAAQSIVISYASTWMKKRALDVMGFAWQKTQAIAHWIWEESGFISKETRKSLAKVWSEIFQTTTAAEGATAREGIEDAANAKSSIKMAWQAAKGAFTWVMDTVPPPFNWILAPLAGAAAFTAVMALGSAKDGEMSVEKDGQLYKLHEKESVLPRPVADNFRKVVDIVQGVVNPKPMELPALAAIADLKASGQLSGNWGIPQSLLNIPQNAQNTAANMAQQSKATQAQNMIDLFKLHQSTTPPQTIVNRREGDIHVSVSALDDASVSKWITKHGDKLWQVIRKKAKSGVPRTA